MDWYSVGLAALSGGLAAFIAALIVGKKPRHKAVFVVLTALLFLAFNWLSKTYILPELNGRKVEAEVDVAFSSIPAYASIKQHQPDFYQDIVRQVTDAAMQGRKQAELTVLIREKVTQLVEARMPHASDQAIIQYIKVMLLELAELQKQDAAYCFQFLFPEVGGGFLDVNELISVELQEQDLAALDELIKTSITSRPIPTEEAMMPLVEQVFMELYAQHGDDVDVIQNPTAPGADQALVCEMTQALYAEVLQLPAEQAAELMRWMFSGA